MDQFDECGLLVVCWVADRVGTMGCVPSVYLYRITRSKYCNVLHLDAPCLRDHISIENHPG